MGRWYFKTRATCDVTDSREPNATTYRQTADGSPLCFTASICGNRHEEISRNLRLVAPYVKPPATRSACFRRRVQIESNRWRAIHRPSHNLIVPTRGGLSVARSCQADLEVQAPVADDRVAGGRRENEREYRVVLSEIDRRLLQRCLAREPRSWEDFVDRFLGLVLHVVHHTSQSRGITLSPADRDDLVSEVFLALLNDDFRVLRRFRGGSSLATYLTVVARRVVVRALDKNRQPQTLQSARDAAMEAVDESGNQEQRITDRDQLDRLMGTLNGPERDVVRLYHLEGHSYRDISRQLGIPANSVGPMLSRARAKMRHAADRGP